MYMLKDFRSKIPAKAKSLRLRILFSFIALAILIVLSTTIIFSSMYIETINEELSLVSSNDLDRINTEFDSLFSQSRNLSRLLKENPDINSFMFFNNFDPLTINRAVTYLKQIQYTGPFFHSVALYNQFYGTVSVGKLSIDAAQFTQDNLKKPDVKSDFDFKLCTMTTKTTTGVNEITDSLSIVFEGPGFNDSSKGNLIIMNLDKEEIEKKLLGKLDGITLLTDESGKVIFNPYTYIASDSIGSQTYFRKILKDKEYKDNFRIKVGNDSKLVTYAKNIESGFYIINLKSISSITQPIVKARTTFIVISVFIALLSCFSAYFLSNKLFSPIKKATEKFVNSKFGQQTAKMTEMDMISKIFEETTEHMRELEDKYESSSSRNKENIVRLLLKGSITPNSAKEELGDCRLNVEFSDLILICIKIDNYGGINENDKFLYETFLCKTIPELLRKDFNCEGIKMYEGEIALLLNYKETEENNFNLLLSSIDKVRTLSAQTLHITLTAGIGGVAESIDECPQAYEKAVEMVKHRFVLGLDRTIYKQLLYQNLSENLSYPSEIEDTLIAAIKANKKNTFANTLNDFISLLGNYYYSEVVSVLFQVMTSCLKTITHITRQENSSRFLNFDEFSSIFSELQTLEHAKKWLISIFDEYQQLIEQINQLKSNRHYDAVEKMQEYIKNKFQDANLSVELIADKAGYTPSYFTRIFKEISGVYINDYIRQVRINKAKELLSIPDCKISDIPALIGLNNLCHFSTVFKKDVGLTPSAYREYAMNRR